MRGAHTEKVSDCELCQYELGKELEQPRDLAAHAGGEHEAFDYKDKNVVVSCSQCRSRQWEWYEAAGVPT